MIKHAELGDPDMLKLYMLLSEAIDWPAGDPRVVEIVDLLEPLMQRSIEENGDQLPADLDTPLADLLDASMLEASPLSGEMIRILEERGWKGWTNIQRVT